MLKLCPHLQPPLVSIYIKPPWAFTVLAPGSPLRLDKEQAKIDLHLVINIIHKWNTLHLIHNVYYYCKIHFNRCILSFTIVKQKSLTWLKSIMTKHYYNKYHTRYCFYEISMQYMFQWYIIVNCKSKSEEILNWKHQSPVQYLRTK